MKRTEKTFSVKDIVEFKRRLLYWGESSFEFVFLEGNSYRNDYSFDCDAIAAAEAFTSIVTDEMQGFEKLKEFQKWTNDWIFGYLSFDLKNDVFDFKSSNSDSVKLPELFFFQPKKIFLFKDNTITFSYLPLCDDEIEEDFKCISEQYIYKGTTNSATIQPQVSREEYISRVYQLKNHIHRGDVYELNYCIEFLARNTSLFPAFTFESLNNISKPPFACWLKNREFHVFSSSPERYLRKIGSKIISQPIKGTAPRFIDELQDNAALEYLRMSQKERAENIMIVDLVRNDLSITATKGSVKVEELCEIYTFPQVHQMISTITSQVDESSSPVDILRTTFPMGSMTGAPKQRALELIEDYEVSKRGVYSGAIGYFNPSGDFDFNVVIRSIIYNDHENIASFMVGSAITSSCIPEQEYQECLLKAKAMKFVLSGSSDF